MELGTNDIVLIVTGVGLAAIFVSGGLYLTVRIMRKEMNRVLFMCENIVSTQTAGAEKIQSEFARIQVLSEDIAREQAAGAEKNQGEFDRIQALSEDIAREQAASVEKSQSELDAISAQILQTQTESSSALNAATVRLDGAIANLSEQHAQTQIELSRTLGERDKRVHEAISGIEAGHVDLQGAVENCAEKIESLSGNFASETRIVNRDIGTLRDSVESLNSMFEGERARHLSEFKELEKRFFAITEASKSLSERLDESKAAAIEFGARLEKSELAKERFHESSISAEQEAKFLARRETELNADLESMLRQVEEYRGKVLIAERDRNEFERINSGDKALLRTLLSETQNELVNAVARSSALEAEATSQSPMRMIGDTLNSLARTQAETRAPAPSVGEGDGVAPEIKPRPLVWTRDLVDRFWNGVVQTRINESSFMNTGGKSVIHLVRRFLPKNARIVDFGSGDGQLSELLLKAGYRCAVVEPAELRSEVTRKRLEKYDNFMGMLDDTSKAARFDAVVMCEVIEHILDSELISVLDRVVALLKPKTGKLILTCPYDEDLELNSVLCPVTGFVYHRQQHVRSLRPETLAELLKPFGLKPDWVGLVNFQSNDAIMNWAAQELPKGKLIPAPVLDGATVSPSMKNATNIFMACSRLPTGKDKPRRTRSSKKASGRTLVALNESVELRKPFRSMGGHGFVTEVHDLRVISDSSDNQSISPLRVFEDGAPLGPAHAAHDAITDTGNGCFSHWGDFIYFTSTDNSDPNTNNRNYTFRIMPGLGD